MDDVTENLNKPLKPSVIDKVSLFHDLDFGPELCTMMEYNPILPVKIFLQHQSDVIVD